MKLNAVSNYNNYNTVNNYKKNKNTPNFSSKFTWEFTEEADETLKRFVESSRWNKRLLGFSSALEKFLNDIKFAVSNDGKNADVHWKLNKIDASEANNVKIDYAPNTILNNASGGRAITTIDCKCFPTKDGKTVFSFPTQTHIGLTNQDIALMEDYHQINNDVNAAKRLTATPEPEKSLLRKIFDRIISKKNNNG